MTTLSHEEIQRLALLANLQLTDEETPALQKNIADILQYITQLNDVDTAGITPTYQVNSLKNIWREDKVVMENVSRETLLSLAPDSQQNSVKVPKVL